MKKTRCRCFHATGYEWFSYCSGEELVWILVQAAFLKAERLKKNKTLKDIADSTRIGIFTLEALKPIKQNFFLLRPMSGGLSKCMPSELDISPDEPCCCMTHRCRQSLQQKYQQEVKHAARPLPIPGYAVPVIAGAVVLLVCALFFGYKGRPSLHN